MSQQWHGGKGSMPRTVSSTVSKQERELRDKLWRAPESDKPKIREELESIISVQRGTVSK